MIPHTVSAEDLALINRLSKANLTAEQVYTFALRLCDNEVDRDWERFDEHGLEALSQLFTFRSQQVGLLGAHPFGAGPAQPQHEGRNAGFAHKSVRAAQTLPPPKPAAVYTLSA